MSSTENTKRKTAKKKKVKTKAARPRSNGSDTTEIEPRKKRAAKVLNHLRKAYPDADCALQHDDALQLLVATILSAQSTDALVNKVTPELFRSYPDARSIAEADLDSLETLVKSTGFFRQKAKNIRGACEVLVEQFGGEVPDRLEDLITLPGVARKTANVILGTWFGKNEGVVVDTHIGRLSHRLDLTWRSKNEKDAVKIERDLMEVVPQKHWTYFGHAIILHGRGVCTARKPRCEDCLLASQCPSAFSFESE